MLTLVQMDRMVCPVRKLPDDLTAWVETHHAERLEVDNQVAIRSQCQAMYESGIRLRNHIGGQVFRFRPDLEPIDVPAVDHPASGVDDPCPRSLISSQAAYQP